MRALREDDVISPEFFAVIGTGVTLGGLILTVKRSINRRLERLEYEVRGFHERMARIEGLFEGYMQWTPQDDEAASRSTVLSPEIKQLVDKVMAEKRLSQAAPSEEVTP